MSSSDLLTLQGNIKKDPDGYKDEFQLQLQHYEALLDVFKLKPSRESKEFGDLAMFIAQVSKCYPKETARLATQLMDLLDMHATVLDAALRRTLVQALVLLRNRNQLTPNDVLPLFFRMFRCQDKQLRQTLFKHIVSDIKNSNKKHRNESLNRYMQNFMYSILAGDDEAAAKKSLAVCTELWRRHVWRDARTVNVIASAAMHKSSRIMLAAVKFFLGTDKADNAEGGSEGEEDDVRDKPKPVAPTKEEIYKANNAGTKSSKKKKQHKLKRVMQTVKKAERREAGEEGMTPGGHENFAALHLLHDPQAFAEKLFSRLQTRNEAFDTRMAILLVVSRVIGVHKLMVLNFYPYLQKYIAPHTKDVTVVLAALVGAVHELVPPETLQPVLRQLVDQFVHDKARPEVMTVGLKTARELCLRSPLLMEGDLLKDLTGYKKFKNKQVSASARGLIGLFRELNPELLAKKDRGKGVDMMLRPTAYGQTQIASRVDGAELLQAAEAAGQGSEEDDFHISSSGSSDEDASGSGSGSEDEAAGSSDGDEDGSEWVDVSSEDSGGVGQEGGEEGRSPGKGADGQKSGGKAGGKRRRAGSLGVESSEGNEGESGSESDLSESDDEGDEEEGSSGSSSGEGEEDSDDDGSDKPSSSKKLQQQPDSISTLKRKLAEAKEKRRRKAQQEQEEAEKAKRAAAGEVQPSNPAEHMEAERILTQEDFERIRRLKHKRLIDSVMTKHGLKSASKAKRQRMLEAAQEEAEAMEELRSRMLTGVNEHKVDPAQLEARKKREHDKEARLATVLAGREGRGKFGASTGMKKSKTGGLSERQKQRKKAMPMAARQRQLSNRRSSSKANRRKSKDFKGHKR